MSIITYRQFTAISADNFEFYALIMAAMRQADTDNLEKLKNAFPETWEELHARYNAPGGALNPKELAWVTHLYEEKEDSENA